MGGVSKDKQRVESLQKEKPERWMQAAMLNVQVSSLKSSEQNFKGKPVINEKLGAYGPVRPASF